MTDDLRASDAERDATFAALSEHAAEGRLTLQELEERVEEASAALTRGQLAAIVSDLPTSPLLAGALPRTTSVVAVLGSAKRVGRWRVGKSLSVVTVLADALLDLRHAALEEGSVHVRAISHLGEINLFVPDTVLVEVDDTCIAGDVTVRGSHRDARAGAPTVRVRAVAILGTINIWRIPADGRDLSVRDAKRHAKALDKAHEAAAKAAKRAALPAKLD